MTESEARKTAVVRLRIDPVHKKAFARAAEREGLDVSAWIRRLALAELRRQRERTRR